ncbi:hypothetical protein RhiirA5_427964 [Rhizophagus irregularis]|uniref:CCHC-type domain-containing protein n=1 Tax=Rhizophagus irregularis TaxID=588596 RepID=A0A2N0P197_9GLOM|nr:hypothetical protein RhiirA5_427964 [Rhizophagus irregularis]
MVTFWMGTMCCRWPSHPTISKSTEPAESAEDYNAATEANGWNDVWKLQVVPAYLRFTAADCNSNRSSNSSNNSTGGNRLPIVCYTCGKPGHISRTCPRNNNKSGVAANTLSTALLVQKGANGTTNGSLNYKQEWDDSKIRGNEAYSAEQSNKKEDKNENNQQQQQPVEDINKAKIKVLKKKKKGKANLYSPISSYVQSYSMVKDIKHPQAWITFGQLIEIAPKCNIEQEELRNQLHEKFTLWSCWEKIPIGEVLNFPITVQGIEVPIDMVVTESETYSVIVGNNLLRKVKANIDYKTSTIIIISDAKQVEEIEEEGSEKEEEKEIENEDEDEEYKELYDSDTIENIVNESNRQLCYYCQKKSYQEYEELTQEIEYNHADIEDLSKITLIELSIGKLSDNQSISLMESYCSDKMTLLGNLLN